MCKSTKIDVYVFSHLISFSCKDLVSLSSSKYLDYVGNPFNLKISRMGLKALVNSLKFRKKIWSTYLNSFYLKNETNLDPFRVYWLKNFLAQDPTFKQRIFIMGGRLENLSVVSLG